MHKKLTAALSLLLSLPLQAQACDCGKEMFDRMKKLTGKWESDKPDSHLKRKLQVEYKLTSGGSVLQETMSPGTEHEMVTLYLPEGRGLAMTHYCMLGNQPHLHARPVEGEDALRFEFEGGSNMDATKDPHMHDMKLTFVSDKHIRQEWSSYQGGKLAGTTVFDLHRKGK